ncbi:Polyadenylate-binding protein 2 [Podila minutissima]|nr:Polyadenylate-binding protein 2 [Podila minutissima]
MAIIDERCPHRHGDQDDDDVCSYDIACANRPYDLRDDIERIKQTNNRIRKSPRQIYKNKKQNKDLHSVHVTNLDPKTTIDELKRVFRGYGPILSATVACNFNNRENTGRAFVEFKDVEDMVKATRLDRTLLRSRIIRVVPKCTHKIAIVRESRKEQKGRGYGHMQERGPKFGHVNGIRPGRELRPDTTSGRALGREITNTDLGHANVAHTTQPRDPELEAFTEKCLETLEYYYGSPLKYD